MSIIITTSRSVIELNADTLEHKKIHRNMGLYYGAFVNDGKLYVAARNRMVSSKVDRANERGSILVFSKNRKVVDNIIAPFPLRDLHQVKWYRNKIWATCSYDNMLAIYDGKDWQRWYPLGKPTVEPFDTNHFNSLYFEGALGYLLAHNMGKRKSEIFIFDIESLEILDKLELGMMSHNIWIENSDIYTCSSGEGKILSKNGQEINVGGFVRGYLEHKSKRYVGVSELATREKRDSTSGKIKVFDMNWRKINELTLAKEGLILDIELADNLFVESSSGPGNFFKKIFLRN